MDLKTELKTFISERFKVVASKTFIERAIAVVEEAPNDKEGLTAAAGRVAKMISLFIDEDLGKEIYNNLREKIDKGFPDS